MCNNKKKQKQLHKILPLSSLSCKFNLQFLVIVQIKEKTPTHRSMYVCIYIIQGLGFRLLGFRFRQGRLCVCQRQRYTEAQKQMGHRERGGQGRISHENREVMSSSLFPQNAANVKSFSPNAFPSVRKGYVQIRVGNIPFQVGPELKGMKGSALLGMQTN